MIAGCAALAAAALLVAWLVRRSRRRQQQQQQLEEGDAKGSPQPELSGTPPSPHQDPEDVKDKSTLWRCKSPFEDTVQSSEKLGWVTEISWDVENQNSEAGRLARQQRASKLGPGVSAPVPATQAFDRSEAQTPDLVRFDPVILHRVNPSRAFSECQLGPVARMHFVGRKAKPQSCFAPPACVAAVNPAMRLQTPLLWWCRASSRPGGKALSSTPRASPGTG